jgi:hypothetical protein
LSIYAVYGCKLPTDVNDLRKLAVKKVGKEDELSITLPLTDGSGPARVWGHVKT